MVDSKDYNKLAGYFVLDLCSAVDYIGDLEAYLNKCEAESLPCDIQYLKNKVADLKFEVFSMYDSLCASGNDKTSLDSHKGVPIE